MTQSSRNAVVSDDELRKALDLHQKGDLKKALVVYGQLFRRKNVPRAACLNTPPLLRTLDRQKDAIKVSKSSLTHFPFDPGIYNNLGNCYLDLGLDFEAISCFRKSISIDPSFADPRLSLLVLLQKHNLKHLAYATALAGFQSINPDKFTVPFLTAYYRLPVDQRGPIEKFEELVSTLENYLSDSDNDTSTVKVLLVQLWQQIGDLDKVSEALLSLRNFVEKSSSLPGRSIKPSFISHWNSLNWNLSIHYLKAGRLKEGWRLYDHGLRVKANGPQRWQRSLKKPFASNAIPLWRGENITGKRLLLLGEQGIGDTMMFATLIPKLVRRGASIYFYPGDRLVPIYRDSFQDVKVISTFDLKTGVYNPSDFDFQSPIGSVCQYGFDTIEDFHTNSLLLADDKLVNHFRSRYYKGKPLLGISWQGGGKANVIQRKSCSLKDLLPICSRTDIDVISLQYGDTSSIIKKFNHCHDVSIICDEEVNAIKDMHTWLAQVASMDFVISIANTTVHGSGGLGIPTKCLVSNQSDWRWIDPDVYKGNYWYDSVSSIYQPSSGEWYNCVKQANLWLDEFLLQK